MSNMSRNKSKLTVAALSILSLWSFPAYANDWSPMDVRESGLEIIAELAEGPGNIAVGPGGRVFLTMHQAFGPSLKLVELLRDGSTRPYPDSEWAYAPDADGVGLHAPLGLQVDQSGVLWVIDNAAGVSLDAGVPKVFAWDTREEALHRVISIPAPYSTPNSFINDLAVDRANNALYLADVRGTDGPALVVIDLETGEMRRRMVNDASFQLEDDAPIVINDLETRNVGSDGKPVRHRSGLNPITLDPNAEWVYYGAMHGTSIYRIRSADLRDFSLTDTELATRVERYGDKPVSDGITIDAAGNVYITDLNGKAIGITKPDGTYETLVTDELMIWPDSVSAGPNGHIWVAINQLNLSAPLNGGTNISVPPFYVARVPAVAPLIVGR